MGVSRALGQGNNRYDGVESAIKMARAISNENIVYNPQPSYERVSSSIEIRGPCPQSMARVPSIPLIISDADRKIQNYQGDLKRGLQ